MAPLITGFIFIGIIASMLLLLAGMQAIASFNAKKRVKRLRTTVYVPTPATGAKVIVLPRSVLKTSKEAAMVNETVSEEII
jgi:hypothetical protein